MEPSVQGSAYLHHDALIRAAEGGYYMNDEKVVRDQRQSDAEDLKLIRKMKKYADDGYDVELRKAPGGGYKTLKVKKELITAD